MTGSGVFSDNDHSLLSICSSGSVLSIGSVGSACSIGSIGSAFSICSVGSFGSVGTALSSRSRWSLMSHDSRGAVRAAHDRDNEVAPVLAVAVVAAIGYGFGLLGRGIERAGSRLTHRTPRP